MNIDHVKKQRRLYEAAFSKAVKTLDKKHPGRLILLLGLDRCRLRLLDAQKALKAGEHEYAAVFANESNESLRQAVSYCAAEAQKAGFHLLGLRETGIAKPKEKPSPEAARAARLADKKAQRLKDEKSKRMNAPYSFKDFMAGK